MIAVHYFTLESNANISRKVIHKSRKNLLGFRFDLINKHKQNIQENIVQCWFYETSIKY